MMMRNERDVLRGSMQMRNIATQRIEQLVRLHCVVTCSMRCIVRWVVYKWERWYVCFDRWWTMVWNVRRCC